MKTLISILSISLMTLASACALESNDVVDSAELMYGDTLVVGEQLSSGAISADLYTDNGELSASVLWSPTDGIVWNGIDHDVSELAAYADATDLADALYWTWYRGQPVPYSGECICWDVCLVHGYGSSNYGDCMRRCGGGGECSGGYF